MKKYLLALALLFSTPVLAADPNADFRAAADHYLDAYFAHRPTEATLAGIHKYDDQVEDYSATARKGWARELKKFAAEFRKIDAKKLDLNTAIDYDLVVSSIQSLLLELESVRMWQKNPDVYSSLVNQSVFTIVSRDFAPVAERMKRVIAREKQAAAVFKTARANIQNPPKIYTAIAMDQISGMVGFFKNDVPTAFKDVDDEKLMAEFKATNAALIKELESYAKYLKEKVLPESNGDFRLGADNYRKKLRYDEMVDQSLESLLKMGYADLRRNQKQFKEVAAKIDSKKKPLEVLADMQKDHPSADELLSTTRGMLGDLKDFIREKKIVTIPSDVAPRVEETPAFLRALTFASMDTPGPFEEKAKEAYFNVTLPEKTWTPEKIEEHMQGFNRPVISSTAIHEAYPGHYTQFLWVQSAPSRVRKVLGCMSNAEGWAHYTEQMMLDEGFGKGDLKLKLGQLQDALLRNARFIVGIEMHTGKRTFEQSIDFFVNDGYQLRSVAERETKRGTADPTYLVYTLGKLQILKLRDDYKRAKGEAFSIGEFHDAFLKQGFAPIKMVRRALLK